MTKSSEGKFPLRLALRGDAVFSFVSGALFVVLAVPLSEWAR